MSTGLYMSTQLDVGLFPVSPNALSSVAVSYATIFSCPLKQPELGQVVTEVVKFQESGSPPQKKRRKYIITTGGSSASRLMSRTRSL